MSVRPPARAVDEYPTFRAMFEAPPMDWNQAMAAIRAARISHAVQDALQEYLGRGLWLDMLSAHEADPQGVVYCSRCWPFVQAIRARYRALVDAGAV